MNNSGKGSGIIFIVLGLVVLGGGIGGYVLMNKDDFFGKGKPNAATNKKGNQNWNVPKPKVDPSQWPSDKPLTNAPTLKLPFILWGGDVATFVANGGAKTTNDSIFAKHGLSFEVEDGNDFNKQVERYLRNETPFLRGTLSMLAQKCDVLGKDPNTQPVVFLQMTWSAGDHMVSRANMKTLADVRGKKISLQKDGPHVGMLDDILRTANLTWGDIQVIWTDDVTGDKGPAAKFRKDKSIDACFAITPDMLALTGGLDKAGDGTNNTIQGAHVLVSTADMKRSIADVYACRKDFYDANKPIIDRFVAGYLKGCEELLAMRREHRMNPTAQYKAVLKVSQDIMTKELLPTEDDAAGLIDDAVFVGLLGNRSFFDDPGNLSGFGPKSNFLLDFAVSQGYAARRVDLLKADMIYEFIEKLGSLTVQEAPTERFRKDVQLLPDNTLYSFIVYFQPNQSDFTEAQYGQDFERALQQASLFGNAIMAVRGHADPSYVVDCLIQTGMKNRALRQDGKGYKLTDGTALDPNNIKSVVAAIDRLNNVYLLNPETGAEDRNAPLRQVMAELKKLSEDRADRVRDSVVNFAQGKQWLLDPSQIKAVGVGATEPVVTYGKTAEETTKNRRVEFRLVRVSAEAKAEAAAGSDFDF